MSDNTRKLIQDTFITLYNQGGMQIVTVKKICVPISRSAFYSYYWDIYSLFEEIQNNLISDLFELNKNFPDTNFEIYKNGIPIDCFDETLKYIKENKKIFYCPSGGIFG